MSVREFLEHCAGIALLVAVLNGCAAVGDWAAQCDGKWRGWKHQQACADRMHAKGR